MLLKYEGVWIHSCHVHVSCPGKVRDGLADRAEIRLHVSPRGGSCRYYRLSHAYSTHDYVQFQYSVSVSISCLCTHAHAHVHVQVFSFSSYHVIPCPMLFLSIALHTNTFNVLTSPFIPRGLAFHDAGTNLPDDVSAQ